MQKLLGGLVWKIPTNEKEIYLTFDDGPTPGVTDWVLDLLDQYNAKATFFCVGTNIVKYPELFNKLIKKEHRIGNHTFDHLNGWTSDKKTYVRNIMKSEDLHSTGLFRPPYGKIPYSEIKRLKEKFSIIMWDVLAGDFDLSNTGQQCVNNVIHASEKGSIVVFHDSLKAEGNLKYALPLILDHFTKEGFVFKPISE